MKLKISILFVAVSLFSNAQELPKTISAEHIQVEGTNVFMVPPKSFELSLTFKGLHDPRNPMLMIMLMEIPGPFKEVSKGFNTEMLKEKGMDFISKKQINVDNYEGLLVQVEQAGNGIIFSKQLLI